jgi:hypothetical protein
MSHVRKRGEVHAEDWCGNLRDTDHSESLGVLENYIKMRTTDTGDDAVEWFDLAHDRDR